MIKLGLFAALAVAFAAAPAAGWSDPATPPAAATQPAPSPEAEALVKRLFVASHVDLLVHTLIHNLIPVELNQLSEANDLTPEQKKDVASAVQDAADEWTPTYFGQMISVYERTFTIEELKATVEFYESPIGQSVVRKSAMLAPAATQIMQQDLPQFRALITKHLCERLDCRKLKTPTKAAAS
jgi:uncharacterized protein